MNNKYYPRFVRRLGIFTMTIIIALFSLIIVPNSTGVIYAQTTNAQLQALLTQLSILKSTVQAQSTQLSQLSAALRAGAVPSLNIVAKLGTGTMVPPGKVIESRVDCPAGSVATGGGQTADTRLQFVQSFPDVATGLTPIGWRVDEVNPTTNANLFFTVFVVCASVTQGTLSR